MCEGTLNCLQFTVLSSGITIYTYTEAQYIIRIQENT